MTLASNTLQHRFMVTKLAKNPVYILSSLSPEKSHLLHMITGIHDEYFELEIAKHNGDKENILEELGDLLFYDEGMLIGHEDDLPNYKFCPLSRFETYQLLGRMVKRHVFYEQDLVIKDLIHVYQNIKEWIRFDAAAIGLTIIDVQNHNMAKLAKRYPNFDYSDTRAKERIDKLGDDDTKAKDFANLMVKKDIQFEQNPDTNKTFKHFDGHKPKTYIDDATDPQGARLEAMGELDKVYKVTCIDNATKEESIEAGNLTKYQADDLVKKLNQAMPEDEPFTFKTVEQ